MIRGTIRIVMTIIGIVAGFQTGLGLMNILAFQAGESTVLAVASVLGTGAGIILYFISPLLMEKAIKLTGWIESRLKPVPTSDILLGSFGLLVGLVLGYFLSIPLYRIPWTGIYLALFANLVMGYLGVVVALNRKEELTSLISLFSAEKEKLEKKPDLDYNYWKWEPSVKVLDTSVIIDGRIYDIARTGFIEGTLLVPGFILDELRHIADSSDLLKRNRGRRGLDILNQMQKEDDIDVQIYEGSVDASEVDSKLVKLAKEMEGQVFTNDYNLNKVAKFHGVPVLNINELANAVKPVALPGEEMVVQIIKDGKEEGQGVAYFDDGTMIVVDGGKEYIGQEIEVTVSSVLQTAAGRMLFARPTSSLQKSYA